ncbi:helix-turn-helix domain-containing protein [Paenibacillus athensensis]|uniref:Helix-turn-helix domain-containing protein n=1 Tax=Paenibacillus athensensis TaxID=1967502 RepID=A0A4Y8PZC9_9BACL|nr:helix-turn-helix domain-containing protein [Paenibacillus athensensis]MCD1258523.1 helix-turn-helix domain-containing protein [Paenibacillus athensensis]
MTTKAEIQSRLDRLIVKAEPEMAVELQDLKRQINESNEIGISVIRVNKRLRAGHPVEAKRREYHVLKGVLLENESYYTVEEVARRFGVTRQAVHKWIHANKIKYMAPADGKRKGYLIPKDQFKPQTARSEEILRRRDEILGGELTLIDPQDVFRGSQLHGE